MKCKRINRTTVELKLIMREWMSWRGKCINRTTVELKQQIIGTIGRRATVLIALQ